MVHLLEPTNVPGLMVEDKVENSVIIDAEQAPFALVHLPYKTQAAVTMIPSQTVKYRTAKELDQEANIPDFPPAQMPVFDGTGIQPIDVTLNNARKNVTTSHFNVEGWCGDMRNGVFTPYKVAWTYDSVGGLTGDSDAKINAVLIVANDKTKFRLGWTARGDNY
uniref:Uncharacterized protein n=1 Tax=viral metagenome TaxID=1070528 RepID=A0A2V0RJ35_9ZZZZ